MTTPRTWISPGDSFHGIGAFQDGFSHILAISENAPLEGIPISDDASQTAISALTWHNLIPAKNVESGFEFKGEAGDRLVGEGVDPSTFALTGAELTLSLEMPVIVTALGWVDPIFLTLWELCRGGVWGSGSAVLGTLRGLAAVNSTDLFITNIEEFLELSTPFSAAITSTDGSTSENITITQCDRETRSITIETPLLESFPEKSLIVARTRYSHGPRREPSVTLFGSQEGMMSPTLVNKITLDVKPADTLSASVEFTSIGLNRAPQIPLRAATPNLILQHSRRSPLRFIEGQSVHLSLLSSSNIGERFGLTGILGDPLVAGYQGIGIPEFTVTGISISVDNRLQVVHSSKALYYGSASRRTRENRFGMVLVSEGRVISGSIKYKSPLAPRAVAERLAGPGSFQGGGIRVNYGGVFALELTDVTWGTSKGRSSADDLEERTLEFTMVSRTRDSMPELLWVS